MTIELTDEQQKIHNDLLLWLDDYYAGKAGDYITFAGYAGTGKTTVLGFLADSLKDKNLNIAFATYTGKASIVLRSKLQNLYEEDFCGTIHSLIYKPIIDEVTKEVIDWILKEYLPFDIIIIDEASMVNKEIWKDLLAFQTPIIAVGDHGQLPPISNDNFSLMTNPDFVLKKIHRQALENPIIKLSIVARKDGYIDQNIYGKFAAKLDWMHPSSKKALRAYKLDDDMQILCGMNKTRAHINKRIRRYLGFTDPIPKMTEKIICLKNNKKKHIMNGQIGIINDIKLFSKYNFEIDIQMIGDCFSNKYLVLKETFGLAKYDGIGERLIDPKVKVDKANSHYDSIELFDFSYAISVHKSQGSEWNKVILIDERNFYQSDEDYARWLYTGVTRAREKLLIIEDYF